MSRSFTLLLLAVLASTAVAPAAFALSAETKGFLEIRGLSSRNLADGTNNSADDDVRGVEQRLRLWTEAAANENVKAVFGLEIDNVWGQVGGAAALNTSDGSNSQLGAGNPKQVGAPGADAKGQIEIKHAYLDFTVPQLSKINVKAGTQYFKQGNGFIAAEDATGLQLAVPTGDNTLRLLWIKPGEGAAGTHSDDNDYYSVQYDAKLGNLLFSPYLSYAVPGKNTEVFFAGFDLTGKLGDTSKVALTAIKNWGDGPATGKVDGLALYGGFFQTLGKAELSVEGAFAGDNGEDNSTLKGEFFNPGGLGYYQATEFLGGGRYDRRAVFGNNLGGATGADSYYINYAFLKLGFTLPVSTTGKLSGYLAHIQEAFGDHAGNAESGGVKVYGQELGLYYDYAIVKNLTYNLTGAYLLNDDFGVGDDDAYKLGTALTYKF